MLPSRLGVAPDGGGVGVGAEGAGLVAAGVAGGPADACAKASARAFVGDWGAPDAVAPPLSAGGNWTTCPHCGHRAL